ncbi:protease 4 [Pasteurella multocida]|nr:protease 4 [Pasteurella multocida]
MQLIVQFFRLCWRILNFIRELVMNIVFLFFCTSCRRSRWDLFSFK